MANKTLNKDIKKAKSSKNTKIDRPVKCSTATSEANPFKFEKRIDFWKSDEGLLLLEGWARDGLTDVQLCEKMNINVTTLWRWCNQEEKISNTIKHARLYVDYEVENAMFKAAMGYRYTEEQLTKDGDVIEVERYMPPSIEAQKFILTNRKNQKWRSKQDLNLNAQVEATVTSNNKLANALFSDDEEETKESDNK